MFDRRVSRCLWRPVSTATVSPTQLRVMSYRNLVRRQLDSNPCATSVKGLDQCSIRLLVDAETQLGLHCRPAKIQIEMAGSGWGKDKGATTARDRPFAGLSCPRITHNRAAQGHEPLLGALFPSATHGRQEYCSYVALEEHLQPLMLIAIATWTSNDSSSRRASPRSRIP